VVLHCTVRLRGIGTGISEASKRVPIFPCTTKQASEFLFSPEELGPWRKRRKKRKRKGFDGEGERRKRYRG